MIYLFSTKLALRKAMVGLANNAVAYAPQECSRIANYLTDGGFNRMDAKIKAQEEELLRLSKKSKSLAEEIKAQQSLGMKEMQERIALQAEIQRKQAELSGLRGDIATAQDQLDSLVAQIGADERAATSTEAGVAYHESWDKAIKTGALKDWVEGGSIVSEEEFAGAIEKGMMASFVNNLKGTP